MTLLVCDVLLSQPLSSLLEYRPAFDYLAKTRVNPKQAKSWARESIKSYDVSVAVFGQTGFGKSSILNSLIGTNVFQTSDIASCTTKLECADFRIDGSPLGYISFVDTPGIGGGMQSEKSVKDLCGPMLDMAGAAIYVLRADQRDHAVDLRFFEELFPTIAARKRLLVALNFVDVLGHFDRDRPFEVSDARRAQVKEKTSAVSRVFSLNEDQVVPMSAAENHGLDDLAMRLRPLLLSGLICFI